MLIDFDIKEKIKELKRAGKKMSKDYFDLGVAYWLLNPDEEDYAPENLSRKYLHKELGGTYLNELYGFVKPKLKEYKLEKLFYEVEMPLICVLADMELAGVGLDLTRLKNFEKDLNKRLKDLVTAIYRQAGEVFNINSSKQLSQVLFEKLKINSQGVKKNKNGLFSTDVDTLTTIKDRHEMVTYLLDYREIFKLKSTYVEPFLKLADKNGRVHTTYVQTGTSTGRLSSQNPNLQNIPIGSDMADNLRKSFVAGKGYKLISFDYSQIELRVLASLSGDPKMIEAFNDDLDIHKMTAANVFNTDLAKVTPVMRRMAKTLNFGVVYGMGANAFAAASGLGIAEARKFITEYFNDFKKIKEWQEGVKAQARTYGYVTNLNGRRRWLLKAVSMFRGEAAEAERAAINMPVQGLAADIIKMAMVRIGEELEKKGWCCFGQVKFSAPKKQPVDKARLLLTIHDELLFEVKDDIIEEAIKFISLLMESVYELEVPVKVNVKIGDNWGDMSEL